MLHFISRPLAVFAAALLMLVSNASAGPSLLTANPAAASLTDKSFKHLPMKKGGSGVELAYQLQGTPEIGKPLVIKIMMHSMGDSQVVVYADDGLQLQSPRPVMQSTAGIAAEHQLIVVPTARGRFYVHVMSSAYGRTSATAIAVQVGADKDMPQAKLSGEVKIMPNGERIISTPAQ